MPARERRKLTDAAIARLRPRSREYTVWDNRVPSLGVRVRNLSTTLRHRRFLFTDSFLLLWKWRVG